MNGFDKRCVALCFFSFIYCRCVWADVVLPRVFADHMVLQADCGLPIWGTASPGELVTIAIHEEVRTVVANEEGDWQLEFPPRKASSEPISIRILVGQSETTLNDIVIGEVWLCAGQSNIEWPLVKAKNGLEEVAKAAHPQLRFYRLAGAARGGDGAYSEEQLARLHADSFCDGSWQRCTPSSAEQFSAVGYYFGKRLQQELDVPIGLISPAIGGTPCEAWIRRASLEKDEQIAKLTQGNWLTNPLLDPWCRERGASNFRQAREEGWEIPGDDLGPNHSFKPGFMWEAAIRPLIPFPIRGVIWYQGESNASTDWRVEQHSQIFPCLVRDWRRQWGLGDFPFHYVQLPALNRPYWPAFREGQRRLLDELPNIGMVVTIDLGHPTNVHPIVKQPVGERLATYALAKTYGKKTLPCGPMFHKILQDSDGAVLEFEYAHDGLATSDQQAPVGFEVAGEDKKFYSANAQIKGDRIVVSAAKVASVAYVRYGWAPYPDPPLNLVNSAGLPASPFLAALPLPEDQE